MPFATYTGLFSGVLLHESELVRQVCDPMMEALTITEYVAEQYSERPARKSIGPVFRFTTLRRNLSKYLGAPLALPSI